MRIVAGAWRGRQLRAPAGKDTRPTADRVRQALFDMLMHAPWGGRSVVEDAVVLDAFAGTGALGLEALSRGARFAMFFERDPEALKALTANVAGCGAGDRCTVVQRDALRAERGAGHRGGHRNQPHGKAFEPASLVFLDPPYSRGLVPAALAHLMAESLVAPNALIVAETGRDETWLPEQPLLEERIHGAARLIVFRTGAA